MKNPTLKQKLVGNGLPVMLYGTTPPKADATEERVVRASNRLAERTSPLALDGVVVYDVQDESARTSEPRPFAFLPTLDPRSYSRLIRQATQLPTITYKCVAGMNEAEWRAWLRGAIDDFGIEAVSLVGHSSSKERVLGLTLPEAIRIASLGEFDCVVGGVVIPERHRASNSESHRLIKKAEVGCDYFVSQAVYNPGAVVQLMRDYSEDCHRMGVAPKRIILTFTPCGSPETLRLMKWLGVSVPADTELAMERASDTLAKSIDICASNLAEVLRETRDLPVPLGIHTESISIRKAEIEGSIELARRLSAVASERWPELTSNATVSP